MLITLSYTYNDQLVQIVFIIIIIKNFHIYNYLYVSKSQHFWGFNFIPSRRFPKICASLKYGFWDLKHVNNL